MLKIGDTLYQYSYNYGGAVNEYRVVEIEDNGVWYTDQRRDLKSFHARPQDVDGEDGNIHTTLEGAKKHILEVWGEELERAEREGEKYRDMIEELEE